MSDKLSPRAERRVSSLRIGFFPFGKLRVRMTEIGGMTGSNDDFAIVLPAIVLLLE